ncbi:MAG: 50S ribosomal protein L3 [Deltaproteobacteria bacterium]|nr:50S ribosomal protein L3 [Deltaproteobacteria bacterium]
MLEGLIGKKIGMTHIYTGGVEVPVTVIKAGPCYVTQKKTRDKDGYGALQIGILEKKKTRTSKPMKGHFDKAGTPSFYAVKEIRGDSFDDYKSGQAIACADVFKAGDYVDVTSRSKGKGFAGVIKRWNFRGGPRSHGSMHDRAPGSIGSSSYPSRVFKGMRMGGHMGFRETTVQNQVVVAVNSEENLLLVRGAVPGAVGTVVVIKKAAKKKA